MQCRVHGLYVTRWTIANWNWIGFLWNANSKIGVRTTTEEFIHPVYNFHLNMFYSLCFTAKNWNEHQIWIEKLIYWTWFFFLFWRCCCLFGVKRNISGRLFTWWFTPVNPSTEKLIQKGQCGLRLAWTTEWISLSTH